MARLDPKVRLGLRVRRASRGSWGRLDLQAQPLVRVQRVLQADLDPQVQREFKGLWILRAHQESPGTLDELAKEGLRVTKEIRGLLHRPGLAVGRVLKELEL